MIWNAGRLEAADHNWWCRCPPAAVRLFARQHSALRTCHGTDAGMSLHMRYLSRSAILSVTADMTDASRLTGAGAAESPSAARRCKTSSATSSHIFVCAQVLGAAIPDAREVPGAGSSFERTVKSGGSPPPSDERGRTMMLQVWLPCCSTSNLQVVGCLGALQRHSHNHPDESMAVLIIAQGQGACTPAAGGYDASAEVHLSVHLHVDLQVRPTHAPSKRSDMLICAFCRLEACGVRRSLPGVSGCTRRGAVSLNLNLS